MARSTLFVAGVLAAAVGARADIVLNEVSYDDTSTDDGEFVELYNNGSAIDISGWQLIGGDQNNSAYTTVTIPSGTILAAGGFYVIGNAGVPNVNQVVSGGFVQNDMELLTLRDSSSVVRDQLVYEANKQAFAVPAGASFVWGNDQSIDIASGTVRNSLGRYYDGYQGALPGRSFGMRPSSPGASNASTFISRYTAPNLNAQAIDTDVAGMTGSYVNPRVIDPTVASAANPAAVAAAPGGNKAYSVYDPAGGGNAAVNNAPFNSGGGLFAFNVYLNTSLLAAGENETTAFGMLGHPDAVFNTPDPSGDIFTVTTVTAAGQTGLAWIFQRTSTTSRLYLVDAKDGGNSSPDTTQYWSVIQTIDLSSTPSGWYELGINVDAAGNGVALFDNTGYALTTDANLVGNLYVGYREAIAGLPDLNNPVAASFSVPRIAPLDFLLGDVNDDGITNNQDIAPFVAALTGGGVLRPDIAFAADVNGDGVVNNQDIAPFVALLTGPRPLAELAGDPDFAPLIALVPEPASLALLALGALALRRRR